VDAVNAGLAPSPSLDLNVDASRETAENRELSQRARTRRLALSTNWRPVLSSQIGLGLTLSRQHDDASDTEQRDAELRLEASRRFALLPGPSRAPAQVFLRFSRVFGDRILPTPGRDTRRSWSFGSGFSISLF
jgi:hypothetical protein